MAGQKSSGRGAGTRQGAVRPGSPTARPASARQATAKGKGQAPAGKTNTNGNAGASDSARAGSTRNGTTTARPGAGASAQANGAARASGPAQAGSARASDPARSSSARSGVGRPRAAARGASPSGAAGLAAGGPLTRVLRAAWSPFRTMGGLPLATLILSLYGFGASIYLTLAHYDSSVTLACSDKGLVNCQAVTTSPESMIFGAIPVAVAGLAFYVFMVAINSPWGWRLQPLPIIKWLRLGSVVAGMAFVLYLIYAELIEIRAICLWCTSVHVATFLIFALLVFHYTLNWESPASRDRA